MKFLINLLSVILCLTASSDIHSSQNNQCFALADSVFGIKRVIVAAESLMQCEILKVEKKFAKEIPVWKIIAATNDGGTIAIEYTFTEIELIQITAEGGLFDYDILPMKESVTFKTAKNIAENHSGLKTMKWSFKKVKQNWEYNFWVYTKSGKAQLRVDAVSGELILKKSKK
ncbi:MAG: hypothetical protein HGGPFJEG_00897 [Ignavibacteria bacterium]|nr:hypothetical protein [Ignavibacteria bacterium]